MRYIGPFFRMNSLSSNDISGQLFHLSKEAIKTIVLNSKCGITTSFRSSKKSSNTDISILNNFSPLICLYRKSSPVFIHNKTSHGFDEDTFKKDILPATNALMTLSILELSNYYSNYNKGRHRAESLDGAYKHLAKEQLDFYYENLRNSEGVFVEKKNLSEGNSKGYNLIDKDKKFNFSDQAFMMNAYYLYSLYNPDDPISDDYKNFSIQILEMFYDFKDALYNLSFEEGCKILLAFNVFYEYSKEEKCKNLIIDFADFLINKFDEKDYYVSALDSCSLFAIALNDSYKHTDIISFNDKYEEILDKLEELYDSEKGIFLKLTDKKEIKYSSLEICFYFLAILLHSRNSENQLEHKNMISSLYKKYFINSHIILSWPEAPTLDETERYRGLSLKSDDMLDESFFRMPNLPSPESSGMAPIFTKSVTYSRKKDSFTRSKDTFDSSKNMLIFFLLIYYLDDDVLKEMNFKDEINLSAVSERKSVVKTSEDIENEDIVASDENNTIEQISDEIKEQE